jgi:hypothetical protein
VSLVGAAALQWLVVLRRYLNNVNWWVYVTGMGYLLSIVVYLGLNWITHPLWIILGLINSTPEIDVLRSVISLQITGFTIGFSQWYVVLRNNKIRNTAIWVSATALAYGLGLSIASHFYELSILPFMKGECSFSGCPLNIPIVILGAVLGSLVIGVVTGVAIIWLLRDQIAERAKGSLPYLAERISH